MDGLTAIKIDHKNDKGLYVDNAAGGSGRWLEIAPDRVLLPFEKLKQILVKGIFEAMQYTETIPQLEYLRDVTLRDAETAENKITESFYEELSDVLNPSYESYHALEDMWSKLQPAVSSYQKKVTGLVEQASKEWFAEGHISKGDLFNNAMYRNPCKVERIENGIIYTDTGEQWEMNNIHPSVMEVTWRFNHPQFRIDDVLIPLDSILDWKLQ